MADKIGRFSVGPNGLRRGKQVDEDWTVTFDFVNRLASGESLTGTPVVTATVHAGTDASPSAIVSGAASISGTKVSQLIIDGTDGVDYLLKCSCGTDASPAQTLHILAYLKVENIT